MKVKHKQFSPTELSQYENVKNTIWEKFKLNTVNNVYLILNKINKHKNSLGDFVECGTFKGSTLLTAAQFCKENNISKKLVGIDTFGGFPYKGLIFLNFLKFYLKTKKFPKPTLTKQNLELIILLTYLI